MKSHKYIINNENDVVISIGGIEDNQREESSLLPDEIQLLNELFSKIANRGRKWKIVCSTCGKTKDDPDAITCSNSFHLDYFKHLFSQRKPPYDL